MTLESKGVSGNWGERLCFFSHRHHFVQPDFWVSMASHSFWKTFIPSEKQTQTLLMTPELSPPAGQKKKKSSKKAVYQQHNYIVRTRDNGSKTKIVQNISQLCISEVILKQQAETRHLVTTTIAYIIVLCLTNFSIISSKAYF